MAQVSKKAKGLQNVKVLVNWGPFYENETLKKVSQCQKKLKGGTRWDFSTSMSENIKKLKGGPSVKKFIPKKSLTVSQKNCIICMVPYGVPMMYNQSGQETRVAYRKLNLSLFNAKKTQISIIGIRLVSFS